MMTILPESVLRIIGPEDSVRLWHGDKGGWGDFLVGSEQPARTELWDGTIAPGDAFDGQVHPEGSREVLYALEG